MTEAALPAARPASSSAAAAAEAERAASAARAAERHAEEAEARRALADGAAERAAERERIRQRLAEERRRRDADPAEQAARDAELERVRAGAEEARRRLRHRPAGSKVRYYSPHRPWEPLSDDEWAVLAPFVVRAAGGPGRPVRDPRARMDAVFWMAAHIPGPSWSLPPWRTMPPGFGKPDTAARQFRRWAHAGLWTRLLEALADPDYPGGAVLRRLESWICRTYRRAWRILGVRGVVLARRLGFLSALRAPSVLLCPTPICPKASKRACAPSATAGASGAGRRRRR